MSGHCLDGAARELRDTGSMHGLKTILVAGVIHVRRLGSSGLYINIFYLK